MNIPWLRACAVGFLVFLAPAAFFVAKNLDVYHFRFLWPSLGISLAVSLFLLVPTVLGALLTRSTAFINLYFGLACLWFLQFRHQEVKDFFGVGLNSDYVATTIVVSLSLVLGFFSKKQVLQRSIVLFLGLNLCLIIVLQLMPKGAVERAPVNSAKLEAPVPVVLQSDHSRHINIYYVIMDGLTSERILKHQFDVDVSSYIKNLSGELSYYIASDARSNYNVTHLTLASIFYQAYPVDEKSGPYQNRSLFFPEMLSNPEKLSLLSNLDRLGYRFTHIGNSWGPCNPSAKVRCINEYGTQTSFLVELLNNYSVQVFFKGSLLANNLKLQTPEIERPKSINDNDAVQTAITFIKEHPKVISAKGNFFFIHHMNPHPPARSENCELLDGGNYIDEDLPGYRSSAICAFRRIEELARLISLVDPTAIVVFQGDHGAGVGYDFDFPFDQLSVDHLDERFSIFNALKLPPDCETGLNNSLGNVETINLVLGCVGNNLPNSSQPRSYAGFYETRPEFGRVNQVFWGTPEFSQ